MTRGPDVPRRVFDSKSQRVSNLARRDLILEHFRLVAQREPSKFAMHKLRKFTGWYTHGLPNGRKLRQEINQLPDVPSFLAAVEDFFSEMFLEAA